MKTSAPRQLKIVDGVRARVHVGVHVQVDCCCMLAPFVDAGIRCQSGRARPDTRQSISASASQPFTKSQINSDRQRSL